jgi:hypothetical protein
MKYLRLATTDYGRDATKPWRTRLLWLADHAAAHAEISVAFISIIGIWALSGVACAVALGWLNPPSLMSLLIGSWIGFLVMIWAASLRRIGARARREMRRRLGGQGPPG